MKGPINHAIFLALSKLTELCYYYPFCKFICLVIFPNPSKKFKAVFIMRLSIIILITHLVDHYPFWIIMI